MAHMVRDPCRGDMCYAIGEGIGDGKDFQGGDLGELLSNKGVQTHNQLARERIHSHLETMPAILDFHSK